MDERNWRGHTPEPWQLIGNEIVGPPDSRSRHRHGGRVIALVLGPGPENTMDDEAEADGALIAAAPRLLRENRELRAERDALKARLDDLLSTLEEIEDQVSGDGELSLLVGRIARAAIQREVAAGDRLMLQENRSRWSGCK